MASVKIVVCPLCGESFKRTQKHLNQVINRSGVWRCRGCVTTTRNKANAKPIGSVRLHAQTGYLEEKCEFGWRRQHILVMERKLGRRLKRGEAVHHKNENKTDNRIENLVLMDHGEHTRLHHIGARRTAEQKVRIREGVRRSRNTRLTMEKAAKIRLLAKQGSITQREISDHFGVSRTTVSRVVNNQTWN